LLEFVFVSLICLFHLYPPATEATIALYLGRIRTCLGVVHFRVFRLFFLTSSQLVFCLFEATKLKHLIQDATTCYKGGNWTKIMQLRSWPPKVAH